MSGNEVDAADHVTLTYHMNRLQGLRAAQQYFVTLNSQKPIRDELIHDTYTFRHPVFDTAALEAQDAVRRFNGSNSTWFCGAWMRNGFHEDGIASAVDVVEAIEARTAIGVAAQ